MNYIFTKEKDTIFAIRNLVNENVLGGTSDGTNVSYADGQTPPTQTEIDAELKRMQDEYDAQEYARNRRPEYPDIGDQLDDLYHKGAFSDEMAVKIKAVKDAHPKPE